MADKTLKAVRKDIARETSTLLFDPEAYRNMAEDLTMTRERLTREQLNEYARVASKIRQSISSLVGAPGEESKGNQAEQVASVE